MSIIAYPFHAFREYKRVYSIFHITEDGIYKEDNVPEDYAGSGELKVEVVHEIFLADAAGRLVHEYYDIPDAMDNEKKVGGGYSLDGADLISHAWYPDQGVGGDSTVRTKLYTRASERMQDSNLSKAAYIEGRYLNQKTKESQGT